MRTAIILTGALRTIKKTVNYLQRNLIDAIPDFKTHGDIFVCVQNDSAQSEAEWELWFHETIRPRSIIWFSKAKYPDWCVGRDRQIANMSIEPHWKKYLADSGSMVEYYQLQLAYMSLLRVEQQCNFRYDYLVRTRTDSIYAKPLTFAHLSWTEEEVAARMDRVNSEMRMSGMEETDSNLLRVFMGTIINDIVLPNLDHLFLSSRLAETDTLLYQPLTASRLRDYIQNGRYIITLR